MFIAEDDLIQFLNFYKKNKEIPKLSYDQLIDFSEGVCTALARTIYTYGDLELLEYADEMLVLINDIIEKADRRYG